MLASALDSHPDIQCRGEKGQRHDYQDWLGTKPGEVSGCITHFNAYKFTRENTKITDVDKVIVLLRDISKRKGYKGKSHYCEPATAQHVKGVRYDYVSPLPLLNLSRHSDRLVLHYELLTNNEDMREIPEKFAREICEFLGVDYHPLKPAFYKPSLEGAA